MAATVSKLLIASILAILATSVSGGGENSEHSAAEDHHEVNIPGVFIFPFACLFIGIIFDVLFSQAMATVFMLAVSFGLTQLGIACLGWDVMDEFLSRCTWYKLDAYYMMFALLPTLIFESAFSLDAQDFKRFAKQILTLAGPAFVLAFVTMGFMMHFVMYLANDPSWQIWYCMLYGAIVSATDPVAVVALLKALGVPHHLKVLIEGESLFNDGAAIFFHSIFHTVLYQQYVDEQFGLKTEIGLRFVGVAMSVFFGWLYAKISAKIVVNMFDSVRERAVVVFFVYACYVTSESMKGSGVLCLVVYGICLNGQRQWMSADAFVDNKRMWGFLAYFANCIIFLMTGILAAMDMQGQDGNYYWCGLAAYVLSVLTRWAAVIIFVVLVVRRFGPCPPEYSPVLIWGGLRGSLALLLALQSKGDKAFEELSLRAGHKEKAQLYNSTLVFISITVLLSNLVQGMTAGWLTRKLGLCALSVFQVGRMKSVTKRLNELTQQLINKRKQEPQYAEVNWGFVEKRVRVDVHMDKEEAVHDSGPDEDPEEEAREAVQRCYEAQLWSMWKSGILSVDVRALDNAINESTTSHGALNVEHLYEHLKASKFRKYVGLFCLKYKNFFEGDRCHWFTNKPQLMDAWHLISAMIACVQGGFAIYLFSQSAEGIPTIYVFANCLIVLFLAVEPIFRLWMERKHLRKVFLKQFVIWPWIDTLSVALYIGLFAAYVAAFQKCKSEGNGGCKSSQATCPVMWDTKNLDASKRQMCKPLITVIAFGVVSLIKLPQLIFLTFRFLIHVMIAGNLQRKDEEALEGLNALLAMSHTVKVQLDEGWMVADPKLLKKLSEEGRKVHSDAAKRMNGVVKKEGGSGLLTTIKTRQMCRELLYLLALELKHYEENGEVGEVEVEKISHTIDLCQRRVQGLHKLTRKNVHEDSDKSFISKKKGPLGKKKKN